MMNKSKKTVNAPKDVLSKLVNSESGMEIISVIFILAIVLALANVFKSQVDGLTTSIFNKINSESELLETDTTTNNSPLNINGETNNNNPRPRPTPDRPKAPGSDSESFH